MNDLQNKLLGSYAAVRINNREEFNEVIEWLSIKNRLMANGEPVSKMKYPGDATVAIFCDEKGNFTWSTILNVNTDIYELVDVKQLELDLINDEKIIEANATVTSEVIELNEKVLTLVANTKPEGATIDSNVDSLVALIPVIKAKANVVVTEENYKSFVAKGSGTVPELRKWAKTIDDEKKRSKKVYMDAFNTYETKVKSVVDALETTAQKIADNVDYFVKEETKKSRDFLENFINKSLESGIADGDISKEYADKFVFNEDWLKRTKWSVYGEKPKKVIFDEIKKEFERLVALETKYKQDIEFIENTIVETCSMVGIDEKLIDRTEYILLLRAERNLGDITKSITNKVKLLKNQSELLKKQAEDKLVEQKKEMEERYKKDLAMVQQTQQASTETNQNEQLFKRGDEIIAKVNGNNVVTEIKETPEKFQGKTWTKTFEFTGDLASLQMLNRYMEFLKQSKEFDFKEVKITEKELADKETGELKKYIVKEIN